MKIAVVWVESVMSIVRLGRMKTNKIQNETYKSCVQMWQDILNTKGLQF